MSLFLTTPAGVLVLALKSSCAYPGDIRGWVKLMKSGFSPLSPPFSLLIPHSPLLHPSIHLLPLNRDINPAISAQHFSSTLLLWMTTRNAIWMFGETTETAFVRINKPELILYIVYLQYVMHVLRERETREKGGLSASKKLIQISSRIYFGLWRERVIRNELTATGRVVRTCRVEREREFILSHYSDCTAAWMFDSSSSANSGTCPPPPSLLILHNPFV